MEPKSLTAAERIAQFIKILDITAYQFGKETGISHQTISNIMTGKNRPSLDTLEAIAKRYPTSASWLLTGKAKIRPIDGPSSVSEFIKEMVPLAERQQPEVVGLTSGAATVEHAQELASNSALRELVESQRQQIATLTTMLEWVKALVPAKLGKMLSRLDAACDGQHGLAVMPGVS